jgi:hypothetical protein
MTNFSPKALSCFRLISASSVHAKRAVIIFDSKSINQNSFPQLPIPKQHIGGKERNNPDASLFRLFLHLA